MLDAGELCNRQVVIATADESILAAARRMRDHRVGCLVVVEGEPGERRPIGILTDRDIVVFAVADERGVLQGILSADEVLDVLAEEVDDLAAVLLASTGTHAHP